MSNWCSNNVTFSHPDPTQVKRMYLALTAEDPILFEEFIPCPAELKEQTEIGEDYMARDEARKAANLSKYAYEDWYGYNINNWGTKWDVADADVTYTEGDTKLVVSFDTAWGPPIAFYENMEEELGWQVDAFYYESGVNFCGRYNYGDDDYYEITGGPNWVKKNIPLEINDMYDISGQMADADDDFEDDEDEDEDDFDIRDNLVVITDEKTDK